MEFVRLFNTLSSFKQFLLRPVKTFLTIGHLWKGQRLAQAGKICEAVSAYHQAFQLKPDLSLDVYQKLREKFKPVEQNHGLTSEIKALLEKGKKLHEAGDLDKAISIYRSVLNENPREIAIYTFLGDALSEHGDDEEAKKYYRAAIALSEKERSLPRTLEQLISSLKINDSVIITHIAINYFPMFRIWYSYFRKYDIPNLLVIALDPIVYGKLLDLGVATYLLPIFSYQPDIIRSIYVEIVRLRKLINSWNISYIHTDIDAFWLRNPLDIMAFLKGDIIGSIAYGTPPDLVKKWGFVLCGGFYSVRATQNTRDIFDEYILYTRKYGHDQNGLNHLLNDYGIVWDYQNDSFIKGHCDKLNLDVFLLSESLVSRNPACLDKTNRPYVFHAYLGGGTMHNAIEQLNKWGIHIQDA